MCFNPGPERRVPSPNRYIADAKFCFCKNNKRIIIITLSIPPPPPLCDAVGGAFYYLGSECDHLPEAGNIIYWYPSIHPYLRLFIVGAAKGGERRKTNTPKAY
jgi:hypothetical protein